MIENIYSIVAFGHKLYIKNQELKPETKPAFLFLLFLCVIAKEILTQ